MIGSPLRWLERRGCRLDEKLDEKFAQRFAPLPRVAARLHFRSSSRTRKIREKYAKNTRKIREARLVFAQTHAFTRARRIFPQERFKQRIHGYPLGARIFSAKSQRQNPLSASQNGPCPSGPPGKKSSLVRVGFTSHKASTSRLSK